jgi:hypothetical protein
MRHVEGPGLMRCGRPAIMLLRWRMVAILEVFCGVCKAAMVWRDAKKLECVSAVKAASDIM